MNIQHHQVCLARLLALGLLLAAVPAQAQHLNAGALTTNQNAQLTWANGAAFVMSSGYVQTMNFATNGTYAGFYGTGLSLTVLPKTVANGGPAAFAPAFGSFIEVRMTLESGPLGGSFAFWNEGETTPGISLSVGTTTPSPLWALSDHTAGAGAPGGDPFGHIHGRRYTATTPGDYVVTFRLFDTSTNGVNGSSIHTAAAAHTMLFRAVTVPEPTAAVLLTVGGMALGALALRRRMSARSARSCLKSRFAKDPRNQEPHETQS